MPKKATGATAEKVSKKQFILDRPKLTAAEVVKQAAAAGIPLKDNYVYLIRSRSSAPTAKAKKSPQAKGPRKTRAKKSAPHTNGVVSDTSSAAHLVRAAREFGFRKSIELLESMEPFEALI